MAEAPNLGTNPKPSFPGIRVSPFYHQTIFCRPKEQVLPARPRAHSLRDDAGTDEPTEAIDEMRPKAFYIPFRPIPLFSRFLFSGV
jgi:hypothetical protein